MKRLLANAAILALLIGGIAVAQTISTSVQLSQDARGPFGVDTQNSLYFPRHLNNNGATPSLSLSNGTPTIVGSDFSGTITTGAGSTGVTMTFATAYGTKPNCVVSQQSALATTPIAYTIATTSISLTSGAESGVLVNYVCSSQS